MWNPIRYFVMVCRLPTRLSDHTAFLEDRDVYPLKKRLAFLIGQERYGILWAGAIEVQKISDHSG